MDDDQLNEMLERLNDTGMSESKLQFVLELLGAAEKLSAELEATLTPAQVKVVRKEIASTMLKVLQ